MHSIRIDFYYCPGSMETMMNEAEVILFPLVIAEEAPWEGAEIFCLITDNT